MKLFTYYLKKSLMVMINLIPIYCNLAVQFFIFIYQNDVLMKKLFYNLVKTTL